MIRILNVSKQFKKTETQALLDVSLDIDQGEFVYLIGKSGSGKSTLLKQLYGEVKPTKGHIIFDSLIVNKLKSKELPNLRRKVGVVFQEYKLLEYKTVYENIAYVLEVTGVEEELIEERVMEALKTVGLKHKALDYPQDCSGGEQQRVAIARAIVHKPKVLIADEPTGNLDPRTSLLMLRLLHKINKTGTTVIMATHDYSFVNHMPARVIRLENGQVKSDRSKNHTLLILNNTMGEYYVV
ncbi:cell division ATP-binding protein FtsE [Alkalibacterium olivapovliticus]|uniref:Cell division ATP-binding protein FtsE n=1 Tax=Alkalibacterium olivapovliticus TaxID=99907 RepID=A0A2T0VYV3_9LACT|nr:cell division ATP-binding protein FtsE [Alkalibacterium olivapovliticus]PRY77522.1 cell division transport system ATP-binding protein [Alkalibacterium olivapovliticus]